jgi:hypothetical protein
MPEGKLFELLLQGNFIPAMSTMVRRECYERVGLYDEQLTYEDFDMWLRISQHYDFVFSPVISAKYRVLPTSMSRTIHAAGQWPLLKSDFRIFEKILKAKMSGIQRRNVQNRLTAIGQQMYAQQHAGHTHYLARLLRYDFRPFTIALFLCSLAGIRYQRLSNVLSFYRHVADKWNRVFPHAYSNEIRE